MRRLKINLQLALPPPPLLNTSVHSLPDKDHESAPKHILLETIATALCCSYPTAPAPGDSHRHGNKGTNFNLQQPTPELKGTISLHSRILC